MFAVSVAAFQFWEQSELKSSLNETMDKSAFYKFRPEAEKLQGCVFIMIEMLKIRRSTNILNMRPEMVKEYFNQKP